MNNRHIRDIHQRSFGVSEFMHLLLDALGEAEELKLYELQAVYEDYLKANMKTIEILIEGNL